MRRSRHVSQQKISMTAWITLAILGMTQVITLFGETMLLPDKGIVPHAPNRVSFGEEFDITTDDAPRIESVAFLRPCAMTHHTDAGQRYVKLGITSRDPNRIRVRAPSNGNIAPPGYYMLFIVTSSGIPSVARFIRLL